MEKPARIGSLNQLLLLIGVFFFICFACFVLNPLLIQIPHIDESIYIYQGWLVAQGKIPYRDFFDFVWPGSFYIVGGIIQLFGTSLWILRMTALISLMICAALTWQLGKRFLPVSWLILLSGFFWCLHIPVSLQIQHHLFSSTAGLAAVYGVYRHIEQASEEDSRNGYWLMAAGLFTGISFICTQSLGTVLGIVLALFIFIIGIKGMQLKSGEALERVFWGFIIPAGIFPLVITLMALGNGSLEQFIYDTFLWLQEGGYTSTTSHLYFIDGFEEWLASGVGALTSLNHLTHFTLLSLQGFLPILGLIWPIEVLWRNKTWANRNIQDPNWLLFLLWIGGVGFLAASFSYPSKLMIAFHGWILYLLAFMGIFQILQKNSWSWKPVYISTWVLFFFVGLSQFSIAHIKMTSPKIHSYGTVEKQLTTSWLSPSQIKGFNQLIDYVHQNSPPGKTFFVYNMSPELYMLTDRHNPTPFQIVMALYNSQKQIQAVSKILEEKKPTFILYNPIDQHFFKNDIRFKAYRNRDFSLPPIESVIEEYYQPKPFGGIILYELKEKSFSKP